MAIDAVLFDLGNTLVDYYTVDQFPDVLRRCLRHCALTLGRPNNPAVEGELFEHALRVGVERSDYRVRPLDERLRELFGLDHLSGPALPTLSSAFLEPIFDLARLNRGAVPTLEALRERGVKTAIVSNTPWGSAAKAWREELVRHGLLERVDAAVFCVEVGWRKPHAAPFERALKLLDVKAANALFVGDDVRWDIIGAQNAGLRPLLLRPGSKACMDGHTAIHDLREVISLIGHVPE